MENEMENIIFGNLRIQLLSEDIVRVECAGKGGFFYKKTKQRAEKFQRHVRPLREGQRTGIFAGSSA